MRSNDHGYFYQLCKSRGMDVSVTNWTYDGHDFTDLFISPCPGNWLCKGEDHLSNLTDRNFDYVMLQRASQSSEKNDFLECCEEVMKHFSDVNPNVKFAYLVQQRAHADSYYWLKRLKELEKLGVTIVDWGKLVWDLATGAKSVPGAAQSYSKNSFIVNVSERDGFHPNHLTGYIVSLMTYCALTGESAVGKDYSFCGDVSIHKEFDFNAFIERYYTYDGATTNFPAIFASEADMRDIQTLIDEHLAAKSYRQY